MRPRAANRPSLAFKPPCLARAVPAPPDGKNWLHEIKFDGYRVQALVEDGRVRILTRTGLDWTTRFGTLVKSFAGLHVASAIIDGEAVVRNGEGVSRFHLLQAELKQGTAARIDMMAFDLLHLNGRDVTVLPLTERKALLRQLLAIEPLPHGHLHYVDHMTGNGRNVLDRACVMGLEGIVSKRADRPYRSGRHGEWTKVKCVRSDPFVVVGYTTQKGTSAIVGALVLGFHDGDALVYAGRVGTGFTVDEARAMADGLAAIRSAPPAFARQLNRLQRTGVTWIEPTLVAQVAWRDVTSDGLLRHATFEHFRTDKPSRDIHRPTAFQRLSR
jgi:bifunctional non-homologous end joining protein LigD